MIQGYGTGLRKHYVEHNFEQKHGCYDQVKWGYPGASSLTWGNSDTITRTSCKVVQYHSVAVC